MEPLWQSIVRVLHGAGIHLDAGVPAPVEAAAGQAGAEFGPEADVEEAEDVARLDGLGDVDEAAANDRSGRPA